MVEKLIKNKNVKSLYLVYLKIINKEHNFLIIIKHQKLLLIGQNNYLEIFMVIFNFLIGYKFHNLFYILNNLIQV